MDEAIIGIDLGTTNSEVAVLVDGRIEIVEIDGAQMLPSVVGLDDDGQLIVGAKARNQFALNPERTIKSIKRKMGESEKVALGDERLTPQEVSALILKELKRHAEKYLKRPVTQAVVTVPAFFSDAQRQATREAGKIAGLEVARIINEPTAACLAFEHQEPDARKNIMAFDLGGGTFDVSIVDMNGDIVEVKGSHGDTRLGGDDIDRMLAEELLNRLHQQNPQNSFVLEPVSANRLERAAENAKIRLSESDSAMVVEDNLQTTDGQVLHLEQEITQAEFEDMIAPILRKTIASVHQALAEAKINISQIDEIILVGGSTRTPAVAKLLRNEFKIKPRTDIHPDLAVAYGAGVMAARTLGCDNQRILVDITPYTFGTSALGILNGKHTDHLYCPLIHAGTPLPTTRSQTFYTLYPGQESVNVTVFQGENEDALKNIMLGDFTIEELDENAPPGSEIVITMSLDLDGILHVRATEKATGRNKDIRIENSMAKLDEQALKESRNRVAQIFGTDTDEIEGGAENDDAEAYAEATKLLEKAEANLEKMDKADRMDAERLITQLSDAISENAPAEDLDKYIEELDDIMFYLDSTI